MSELQYLINEDNIRQFIDYYTTDIDGSGFVIKQKGIKKFNPFSLSELIKSIKIWQPVIIGIGGGRSSTIYVIVSRDNMEYLMKQIQMRSRLNNVEYETTDSVEYLRYYDALVLPSENIGNNILVLSRQGLSNYYNITHDNVVIPLIVNYNSVLLGFLWSDRLKELSDRELILERWNRSTSEYPQDEVLKELARRGIE